MQLTRSTVKALLLGENTAFSKRLLLASVVLAVFVFAEIMLRNNSSHSIVASQRGPLYLAAFLGLLSAYNAYVNKGVLVSLAVVAIPTFGYMSTGVLFGSAGEPLTFYEEHIIAPIMGTVVYGSILTVASYGLGTLLRQLSHIAGRNVATQ